MSNVISEQAMCRECCLVACNISGNSGCTLCRKCQARQGGALGQHESCRSCNCSACSKVLEFQRNGDRVQLNDPPLNSPASPRKDFSRNRLSQLAELQQFSGNHQPCSICRSDEEEDVDDSQRHFVSPTSEFAQDFSDLDSVNICYSQELYSYNSVNSSPRDSPRILPDISNSSPGSSKVAYSTQANQIYLRDPGADAVDSYYLCGSLSPYLSHVDKKAQQPLDFERNGLIWCPPPPEEENDNEFFGYDVDEYDDIEDSGTNFSSSSFSYDSFPFREKPSGSLKERLRTTVRRHFTALVLQLLKDEKIHTSRESWLEVVSSLAWQAASFVKPDVRKGGSMDPSHYVKVKCITSGNLSDSSLIKGIVFTKNVKHKRMVSQHKSPRLLLLGGSLEYQRVSSKLASINTVMEEESNNLKIAVSKIEAYRPNVLLVEKTVSPYAQEYLLDKGISLVLNVKRSILERICRCTGAQLVPSIDHIASAHLGRCEVFRVEKVLAASAFVTHNSKRSVKTLMYFEGCPRRLGCTVILRGTIFEELKKVKRVVLLAIFAAYHLLLQTSFLVDEGATLPKPTMNTKSSVLENLVNSTTKASMLECPTTRQEISKEHKKDVYDKLGLHSFLTCSEAPYQTDCILTIEPNQGDHGDVVNPRLADGLCSLYRGSSLEESQNMPSGGQFKETCSPKHFPRTGRFCVKGHYNSEREHANLVLNAADDPTKTHDAFEVSEEYFSTNDNQSILVSLSSTCIPKGAVCERSQLLRIKFYGSFDRPLGNYLLDDLFNQTSSCRSCNEPAEVHSRCYTHQQGSLTITVRRLTSTKLPGERDGKIWMWHRCLKCQPRNGIPPATHRVVLSDAAWGLSFGKFLELSFSNHATANRLATCGHSLQKDCLRFYGWGSMVALFRYSPLDILSVYLPPLIIDFSGYKMQDWLRSEAMSIMSSLNSLHLEVHNIIQKLELKIAKSISEPIKGIIHRHILQLKDVLKRETDDYSVLLKPVFAENNQPSEGYVDILELNRLKRSLLIDSILWDHRLCILDSLSKSRSSTAKVHPQVPGESSSVSQTRGLIESIFNDDELYNRSEESTVRSWTLSENWRSTSPEEFGMQEVEMNCSTDSSEVCVGSACPSVVSGQCLGEQIEQVSCEGNTDALSSESLSSAVSTWYDRIDSAWTGSCESLTQLLNGNAETGSVGQHSWTSRLHYRKLAAPVRVSSFDSVLRFQKNVHQRLSPLSMQLSSVKSFGASKAYRGSESNPITRQAYIKRSVSSKRLNFLASHKSVFIPSFSCVAREAARLLIPQGGPVDIVIAVYDNEPTSIIAYAVCSQEHANFIDSKADQREAAFGGQNVTIAVCRTSTSQVHSDDIRPWCYGSGDSKPFNGGSNANQKELHFKFSYVDDYSIPGDKVKFSVICYFAKQFDALRRKCCPNNLDFIRSLSRCKKWNAQGGKSNVYFAKSWDERFIVKQVTRTELESFGDFAPEYFNYLSESINSGSPTCLAKVLGIYQVTIKHFKGGREMKMDLMVMENLLYERNVSRVYDLKGSSWARYNADTSGSNKVLLDLNLLETLRTRPIFLGSRAKRKFERAIWNDTSFLASIDVMDYSLLVGVDESKKELVIGIIDYMRQYTWDKHLETWVKASGILGGPKNASPTVISPLQYKKRFRKAMSKYFPTVPDQWSS